MKRRQLMRYSGAGLLTAIATGLTSQFQSAQAQTSALSIQWLGHTCFLFTGDAKSILVNPFRPLGCTAGYRAPKVATDLVLISSRTLDEGAIEEVSGAPKSLFKPGIYQFSGKRIEGVRTDHDRIGGKQFGFNVAWKWKQGGINILHLGGIAGKINVEQKILLGRPDLVLIPVGGGPKAYNPQEAKQAVQALNPRLIIPTHFRTQAADSAACDIVALDEFLTLMEGVPVRRASGDTVTISTSDLPANGSAIQVLTYQF